MAKRSLWMTNPFKSRFTINIDPKYGKCNTEEVENMASIIAQCIGTKNMKMKHYQKVCKVVKRL